MRDIIQNNLNIICALLGVVRIIAAMLRSLDIPIDMIKNPMEYKIEKTY